MAKRTNAVVAINGDYYGARTSGYVLRQGVEYKDNLADNLDVLLIDEDGDFHVILAGEEPSKKDKTTWNGKKVINGFCFGPALIVDNEVVLNEASSPTMSAPESQGQRMCIIQTGPLQYTVLCCIAVGCTAKEMVDLVFEVTKGKDVKCAYLLDGGESSQMCFLGYIVNKENRRSREISDIIYFASAWQPEE